MLDEANPSDTLAAVRPGSAPGNRLLAALPPQEVGWFVELRAAITIIPGQVILEPEDVPEEVLFPAGGTVLTLLALLPDRKPVETVMIGAEGATGALYGPQSAGFGFRLRALTGGPMFRIPARRFAEAMANSAALRAVVGRYAAAQLAQLQIGVACAALHAVEARAARWMLDLQARVGDRALPLTQEALADLLGVRRTTITRVVAALEDRGLVRHRRGRIIVTDGPALQKAACACHERARERFEALAPGLYPSRELRD